jgi:hypothetical protein
MGLELGQQGQVRTHQKRKIRKSLGADTGIGIENGTNENSFTEIALH